MVTNEPRKCPPCVCCQGCKHLLLLTSAGLLTTSPLRQGKTVLMEDLMLKCWQEQEVRMRIPLVPLSSLLLRACLR